MKAGISLLSIFAIMLGLVVYSFQNLPNAQNNQSEMVVYQSKTCGCCKKWVEHLVDNGIKVKSVMLDDVTETKTKLGIPPKLGSCHTATINGYLVEGHVPATDIKKMLEESPKIKGISVPGMPMGSPGMEGDYVDSYDVISFTNDGTQNVFSRY